MAEWLKAHDSKSCGQQCLGGSNPLASARMNLKRPSYLGLSDYCTGSEFFAYNSLIPSIISFSSHLFAMFRSNSA